MYSVTFVSNYINHHQLPFCQAMWELLGERFHFIQTMPMEKKRIDMGWGLDPKEYPFVELFYEKKEDCRRLILDSDIAIFGWSEGLISDIEDERISADKLSFRMSERIYREGQWKFISPAGLKNKYLEHIRYRRKPVYLLCTGAYVASDFALIHSYPGKMLKWGYFPDGEKTQIRPLLGDKVRLCWAGRLIDLKHPEYAIEVAKALKEKNYNFSLEIIGDGRLKPRLEALIVQHGLSAYVHMTGGLKPAEVRERMRDNDVFLFTSNYLEGWGAVVNEAMMSGCCVVASDEAGAVPFLIADSVNGLCYSTGNCRELIQKVEHLFINRDRIKEYAARGMKTIDEKWNARNAATELLRFSREFLEGKNPEPSAYGPMSKATIIKPPGILRTLSEKNKLE